MTQFDHIAETLFDALAGARSEDLVKLQDAIRTYKGKYGRTWTAIRKQPAARKMIDAIEEALELEFDPMAEIVREHGGVAPDSK